MTAGFDPDKFLEHLMGAVEVVRGNKIYNPFTGEYVSVRPETIPPVLSQPGPNSTESRLAHVQTLVANGIITKEQGDEVAKRILASI
jgi:hypothetical protein